MQALWRIGVRRRYRDNQLVQRRGDSASHALIVISGRLRSTACSATCLLLARMLSLRVNELFDVIFSRAGDSLATRVWDTVQRLALENGKPLGKGGVALKMSQTDLARAVGASRQRVNVHLRELQRCGRLRLGYGQIEVI